MSGGTRPLIVLGAGRIARTLLAQLADRDAYLNQRYGLRFPIAGIASSRFAAAGAPFLSAEQVEHIARHGLEGDALPADGLADWVQSLEQARGTRAERPILVDLTAADGLGPVLLAALERGWDVALANKKPLCDDCDAFARLTSHPVGKIGYEATVGAGLPIIRTLRALRDVGDELIDATACLSGTLGFICTELEDGNALSTIVPAARALGFTEPDPREDLSGADVRRKALILARTMGQSLELDDVPRAPLIPLGGGPVDAWLKTLPEHDAALQARARGAREQGNVLRYVARIDPTGCDVGLHEVPRVSAVGRLRGADNILTMRTRLYDARPLTISGPGAGRDVTAAAVFADLLHLAGAL